MSAVEITSTSATDFPEIDRHRLATLLEAAITDCFPSNDMIGGSPQRNFFFRKLLRRLIDNCRRMCVPAVSGTLDELYAFIQSVEREWQRTAVANDKRQYQRSSMRALISNWKASFRVPRETGNRYGHVTFFLERLNCGAPHFVVGARISDFVLSNGGRASILLPQIPPSCSRLPASSLVTDADDVRTKSALIDRHAREIFKESRVRERYSANLRGLTLDEVKSHIRKYRQHLADGNVKAVAAGIALILMLGAIGLSISRAQRFVPSFNIGDGGSQLSNVRINEFNEVAAFNGDRQVTRWADRIVTDHGTIEMKCDERGCRAEVQGSCNVTTDVSPEWYSNSEQPMPLKLVWGRFPCNKRRLVVWGLIDTREFFPTPRSANQFALEIEPEKRVTPSTGQWLNSDHTHLLVMWDYPLDKTGDYSVDLLYTPARESAIAEWPLTLRTTYARITNVDTDEPSIAQQSCTCSRSAPMINFGLLRAGASFAPQVAFAHMPGDDSTAFGIAVVPDLDFWPAYGELEQRASYGVRLGERWIPRSQLSIMPLNDMHSGYDVYFAFDKPTENDRIADVQLVGTYRGVPLRSSQPVDIRFDAGTLYFVDGPKHPIFISSAGSAIWGTGFRPSAYVGGGSRSGGSCR